MALTAERVDRLLHLVSTAQDDRLDCDGCFWRLAALADVQLSDQGSPDALAAVEAHLQSCAWCADEYQALLVALKAVENVY